MTTNVVDLNSRRRDPHISGAARCLSCGHEWVQVAPEGTHALACPRCRTERGVWDWPMAAGLDWVVWTCSIAGCGSQHFKYIVHPKDGVELMCCKCGYGHPLETVAAP